MICALIPVKDLDGAKTRLGEALSSSARRELVVAMYRDVLAAAVACPALNSVFAVSGDGEALALADAAGAEGLHEPRGLNEALSIASRYAEERGTDRVVVLFADLPLANEAAIGRVARSTADVAIVGSRDGGTNALALTPGSIAFQYGPDSAARHTKTAQDAGLRVEQLDEASLAFDIDTPDDLARLRQSRGIGAHTRAVLDAASAITKR